MLVFGGVTTFDACTKTGLVEQPNFSKLSKQPEIATRDQKRECFLSVRIAAIAGKYLEACEFLVERRKCLLSGRSDRKKHWQKSKFIDFYTFKFGWKLNIYCKYRNISSFLVKNVLIFIIHNSSSSLFFRFYKHFQEVMALIGKKKSVL